MPRLTVDLSKEVDDELNRIAKENHISKADAMRRAFALLAVANDEKKKGKSLGIISEDAEHRLHVDARIIGF